MMRMKKILMLIAVFPGMCLQAQDSTRRAALSVSGYAELYYLGAFHRSGANTQPGFLYSHHRQGEAALNLGFIKISHSTARTRASLALAAGTYMNANYSAEPGTLKHVFEANAGIRISKNRELWLDAGIFPSHIGFESAISKDCAVLTRSLAAESSPYYESGVKITYNSRNKKWLLSGMLLNGWQRITRQSGNTMPAWGTQLQYKPNDQLLLNYSSFAGSDKPDSFRLFRLFHNIYGVIRIHARSELTLGFDIGTEQILPGSARQHTWFTPLAVFKYTFTAKWGLGARAEYYHDPAGVIISTGTANGFRTGGFSLNVDYTPFPNVLTRIEARYLRSRDAVFGNGTERGHPFITSSLAIGF